MKLLLYLSDFIVPVTILGIVAYGVFNKVNVYDAVSYTHLTLPTT